MLPPAPLRRAAQVLQARGRKRQAAVLVGHKPLHAWWTAASSLPAPCVSNSRKTVTKGPTAQPCPCLTSCSSVPVSSGPTPRLTTRSNSASEARKRRPSSAACSHTGSMRALRPAGQGGHERAHINSKSRPLEDAVQRLLQSQLLNFNIVASVGIHLPRTTPWPVQTRFQC